MCVVSVRLWLRAFGSAPVLVFMFVLRQCLRRCVFVFVPVFVFVAVYVSAIASVPAF